MSSSGANSPGVTTSLCALWGQVRFRRCSFVHCVAWFALCTSCFSSAGGTLVGVSAICRGILFWVWLSSLECVMSDGSYSFLEVCQLLVSYFSIAKRAVLARVFVVWHTDIIFVRGHVDSCGIVLLGTMEQSKLQDPLTSKS